MAKKTYDQRLKDRWQKNKNKDRLVVNRLMQEMDKETKQLRHAGKFVHEVMSYLFGKKHKRNGESP